MRFLSVNILPIAILSINFAATISYYVIYTNRNLKHFFSKLPVPLQKMYVGLFILPLFTAPFVPQSKFLGNNVSIIFIGIIFAAIGFSFILMSFLRIGIIPSIKSKGGLSKTGVYGIVRHPIYAGTILVQIGLTLVNQSLVTLIYLPFSIIFYLIMAMIEEKDLINTFGQEYIEYKENVRKRVIPFII